MRRQNRSVSCLTKKAMPDAAVQPEMEKSVSGGVADVVFGILTYNNAEIAGRITRDAQAGLATIFPGHRCVIVHADAGSRDGTREHASAAALEKADFVQIEYPVYPAQKISPEHYGVPGKANGVQAIFGAASDLGAAACAIVDTTIGVPDSPSIEALVRPVVEDNFDFVTPIYLRTKYDAAMLNGIVYPLTRALYGKRVHQTIGGDYAVSGKFLTHMARQQRLDGDTTSSDADAWITAQALCGGFRFAEALLGPRVLTHHEPAPEARSILTQTLGSVYAEMNRSAAFWQRVRGSQSVPIFGSWTEHLPDPSPVDPNPMMQSFRLGYENLQDIYRVVLPPATLMELKRMAGRSEGFHFDDTMWARVIYDFALAWRMRVMDRDHLLGALTPLYLGWVASWIFAVRDADATAAQERIEALCMAYEAQKAYMISRWRWPDRFNP